MKQVFTYLLMIMMAVSMVIACGDDSGGGNESGHGPQGEALGITCLDLIQTPGEPCDSVIMNKPGRAALSYGIGNVASAIFNSGILISNQPLITEMEIRNYTTGFIRFYLYWDMSHVAGCEYLNSKAQTYPMDILPMNLKDFGDSGSDFDICAALDQPSYITIGIYNADHLALDELGDNEADEMLYNATIHFTLTE